MTLKRSARSLLHDSQLGELRERASALVSEQVTPAVSQAATTVAAPFRSALDYLPLLAEYAGPILHLLRSTRGQVEDAGAQAMETVRHGRGFRARMLAAVQPYVIGAAAVGACYVAYKIARPGRRLASRSARSA